MATVDKKKLLIFDTETCTKFRANNLGGHMLCRVQSLLTRRCLRSEKENNLIHDTLHAWEINSMSHKKNFQKVGKFADYKRRFWDE